LQVSGKAGKTPENDLVGVAGFEPATPASRTSLPVGKHQQNQRISKSFDHCYRRLFTGFRWSIGGWKQPCFDCPSTYEETQHLLIKSHPQAALTQRVFRHVHVSSSIEIPIEFSFVGTQGGRERVVGSNRPVFESGGRYKQSPTHLERLFSKTYRAA
jgi:hypothetical protein